MDYDYDIIVVGGGPAGLSAAVRARRVRTYNLLPASVLVLNCGEPGGLCNWKEVYMTGPGWSYKGDELLHRLMADIELYNIEIRKEEVTAADLGRKVKSVSTEEGEYRSLGVIIGTGMKKVRNERDYLGCGLLGTLKGYKYMEEQFEDLCARNPDRIITFIGTGDVDRTLALFDRINDGRMRVKVLCEPPVSGQHDLPEDAEIGWLSRICGDGKVEGVEVDLDGKIKLMETDFVCVDFESYMLRNNTSLFLKDVFLSNGFINVDRHMHTKVSGVFAAGDVTGPPFSVAKAVGQGVTAGLECYRYVYRLKFGCEAPMYAFYAIHDALGEPTYFEAPGLKPHYRPKVLGRYEVGDGAIKFSDATIADSEINRKLLSLSNGQLEVNEIISTVAEQFRSDREEVRRNLVTLVEKLVCAKEMAIHV